jgi:hypothetical protein
MSRNGFTYLQDDLKILKEKCEKDFDFMKNDDSYKDVVTSWDGAHMKDYCSHYLRTGLFFVNDDRI